MEPRSTKNGATSILIQELNLWTSKTPITKVSCKSNEFDKFTKKRSLSKGIFPNLDRSKIFTNIPDPYVKLNEENDGEVAEAVRPNVLKLCTYFLQKWSPGPPKTVLPRFLHRMRICGPQEPLEPKFRANRTNSIYLPEKVPLIIVRKFFQIWTVPKFSQIYPIPM